MLRSTKSRRPIRVAHCEFAVAAPTNVPRALMAGEYPPTNSSADAPHANPTSLSVSKHIGNGRHDWIDIVPYAPVDTPSGLVDRVALNAGVISNRAIQTNWIARIACRVDECGTWSAAGMAQQVECSARSASRALCGFKNFRATAAAFSTSSAYITTRLAVHRPSACAQARIISLRAPGASLSVTRRPSTCNAASTRATTGSEQPCYLKKETARVYT